MSFGHLAGVWLIVRRSLRQHAVSTVVTALSVALGSGLVMALFQINAQSFRAFTGGPIGFDAVVGARGSQLQLVLNTVFHLETSPGNIPWSLYQELAQDRRVALAIPYAVGDNYEGFRVVGTSPELFSRFEYQKDQRFECTPGGEFFDPTRREAVVGATAAAALGLRRGSRIQPYHGLVFDPSSQHEEEYVVTGVLEPTSSPSDRVIWIPIEGIFRMGGHVLRGAGETYAAEPGEAIPDAHKEVSAVMLKFRTPKDGFSLQQDINRQGKEATLAWPIGQVMAELFDKLGWVHRVLRLVAYLVVVVAAAGILASIYNTMNERRREFAILRSLGARRSTVFQVILLESGTIAALGAAAGWLVYASILLVAAGVVRAQTGVVLDILAFHPALVWTPVAMTTLGVLSGLAPGAKAYRTAVAENLLSAS